MDAHMLNTIANFIWGIADDCLRDVYVRGKYRDVILPMTVIRPCCCAGGKGRSSFAAGCSVCRSFGCPGGAVFSDRSGGGRCLAPDFPLV